MTKMRSGPPVQVICDLRQFTADIGLKDVDALWQKIASYLVGRPLVNNQPLAVSLQEGDVLLWIVDNQGTTRVHAQTPFMIVDILRNATLIYRCKACGEYGPLRCIQCAREQRPDGQERLCSKHAHFIDNRLQVYCQEHRPPCECPHPCSYFANFRCSRCHRFFGPHYRIPHPQDKDIDYCYDCYQALFSHCEVCPPSTRLESRHVGRLQCAYKTRTMSRICGTRLCWEHGQQWKIWGPHCHGITFCEQHKRELVTTDPVDVLAMMIMARPPQRGQFIPLTNVFHLRHILNRERHLRLSFTQIDAALRSLEPYIATGKDREGKQRYHEIIKAAQTMAEVEKTLLQDIKAYYRSRIGYYAAETLIGLNIVKNMAPASDPPRYLIELILSVDDRGPFIGRDGNAFKQLMENLPVARIELRVPGNGQTKQ
jgi:hypothetical protein